jgi:hypothetical protein
MTDRPQPAQPAAPQLHARGHPSRTPFEGNRTRQTVPRRFSIPLVVADRDRSRRPRASADTAIEDDYALRFTASAWHRRRRSSGSSPTSSTARAASSAPRTTYTPADLARPRRSILKVVKSETLEVQTIGLLRPLSAASLEPAARSDRRHGLRFLTYRPDRDNVRRDRGDWHEGARRPRAAHPASPRDERTSRDDQE